MSTDLITVTLDALRSRNPEELLRPFHFQREALNELLFFLKPECFFASNEELIVKRLETTFSTFDSFDIEVSGAAMLTGPRLDQLSIMAKHYGYINTLSTQASKCLSQEDRAAIYEAVGCAANDGPIVLGGHEFLSKNPGFNEQQLNELWLTKKSEKIRSGMYVQRYDIEGQSVVLVNAFHPMQLRHYTHPDHAIVIMLLHSGTRWQVLKDKFAGDTYPDRAVPDSLRGQFYARRDDYGFADVSIAHNCIHLSAGPFEALFEIRNFLEPLKGSGFALEDTRVAKLLAQQGLTQSDLRLCLQNPTAAIKGSETDLFTFTENKNSDLAVMEYQEHFRSTVATEKAT